VCCCVTAAVASLEVCLQELIKQKEDLESNERDITERVWRTRRAILDKKAELEALEQQRGGVDREGAVLAEEVLRLQAEMGQCAASASRALHVFVNLTF
jgi:chromosome segregation ATPase